MKHLDLFSGIGGFALACQWVGIETIGFVEIDKYCQKVLRKHWPGVPIIEDIRDIEKIKEIITNAECGRCNTTVPITRSGAGIGRGLVATPTGRQTAVCNIETTDRNESPTILITAGFPCQPFSVAGQRRGEADDRYLWPETIEVIKAIKPKWVLLENVAGIINLALGQVLSDLEGAGYSTETLVIPACAVNAWHRRDRVWIVAYLNEQGLEGRETGLQSGMGNRLERCNQTIADTQREGSESSKGMANTRGNSVAFNRESEQDKTKRRNRTGISPNDGREFWAIEPELGRVAHGIPNRVDRLKCLGNAIVPQVAYEIIKVIKEIELQ